MYIESRQVLAVCIEGIVVELSELLCGSISENGRIGCYAPL